jgi:hypothetical protein
MIVNAQPADHRVGLDREVGEAGRSSRNAGCGSDDKSLVRGKGQASVGLKFMLDVIGKSGSIRGTFVFCIGCGGRREVIHMQGQ